VEARQLDVAVEALFEQTDGRRPETPRDDVIGERARGNGDGAERRKRDRRHQPPTPPSCHTMRRVGRLRFNHGRFGPMLQALCPG
jgi:hypothetical protein